MLHQVSSDLASALSGLNAMEPGSDEEVLRFAQAVDEGLTARPRFLESQYLYDARGSELFEAICEQPEYYPTRVEAALLEAHSAELVAATGPITVVELGAGTSRKTEHLLRAYHVADALRGFVAVDVSASALEKGQAAIGAALPEVECHAICSTYESAFPAVSELGRTMLVFLGSTIGNFPPDAMADFFGKVADTLRSGEYFLLGVDLHKEVSTLEAAYNDAAGVTAAFTVNLFSRMNRELKSGIDLTGVKHRAHYNTELRQIEIFAEFERAQTIEIAPLGKRHRLSAGERIQTEVSRKFTVNDLAARTAGYGLVRRRVLSDPRKQFALLLFERVGA